MHILCFDLVKLSHQHFPQLFTSISSVLIAVATEAVVVVLLVVRVVVQGVVVVVVVVQILPFWSIDLINLHPHHSMKIST